MKIFTIGFTKKPAEEFFTRLRNPEIRRLIDVRLNNVSQLAGFAKKDDLRFFAKAICGIEYIHLPSLAPTHSCEPSTTMSPESAVAPLASGIVETLPSATV